jgi:phthiocerol/phenolphthiocerol synthesis type-I polyketide synthase E
MTVDEHNLDVAIIGMAGRFPGANTVAAFWRNLCAGVESVTFFSDAELRAAGIAPAVLEDPSYVKAASVLDDPAAFDASFFGYAPREAELMDPQHRFFLECAWEALEDAGYDPERYDGAVGVYGGTSVNSYLLYSGLASEFWDDYLPLLIGGDKDFLATRVSYKLNLRGPSVTVQCGCSTSLVAVHLACQSVLNGECDMALAGGVSVRVPHRVGYFCRAGSIHSPDGHCRAFDAKAQGTVFGSGVGIVVLKRLTEAVADRDHIYAVVKGSAVNNDGSAKVGYTAPSVRGQTEVVVQALANSGVAADTVAYVEAHGTATTLGDPVEIRALTDAFRAYTGRKGFCAVGSVKTNVGHLDVASGVTGLIKTSLSLTHRMLPPSLHFEKPNPEIDFDNSPFYVNRTLCEWESHGYPRRAGVSALGVGGTNAHVVLEEAPAVADPEPSRPWQLLVLSARTEAALDQAARNLVRHLQEHPDLDLAHVAYTLQTGRRAFAHRWMVVARDLEDAVQTLKAADPERVKTASPRPEAPDVVFMFSGQGAQYVRMGRELYQTQTVFREYIDRCSEVLRPHLSFDLREVLYPEDAAVERAEAELTQTRITQPALFAFEYALARQWMAWGVHPRALVGHSIGEYVAACLAGVFSLEDALGLVAARGRLIQSLPAGSMLAVPVSEQEIRSLLCGELSLAVVNAPSLCVVSGGTPAVDRLEATLTGRNLTCRRLHTSHAFHSGMMEPVLEEFTAHVRGVRREPPQIPFVSDVTGTWITAREACDPAYWASHLRQTVRFSDCLHTLLRQPGCIFLEVGPGRTLSTLLRQHPDRTPEHAVLSSTRHPQEPGSDVAFLLQTLGQLWLAGVPVDWSGLQAGAACRRVPLPTYPFEHKRYWVTPTARPQAAAAVAPRASAGPPEFAAVEPMDLKQRIHENACDPGGNGVEQALVIIWQEVLGVGRVGVHDDFFELGGNSLVAVQVIAQVRKRLGAKLSVRQLFESPTISRLAGIIEAASAAGVGPVSAHKGKDRLETSLKRLGRI